MKEKASGLSYCNDAFMIKNSWVPFKLVISYFIVILLITASCQQNKKVPVPNTSWDLFNSPKATNLNEAVRQKIEGVYSLTENENEFGEMAVLKWSYTVNAKDTTFHLSMFCEKDKTYFICEGKQLDSSILINGFWRNMANDETGKARFIIQPQMGAKQLLDNTMTQLTNIIIDGNYGDDEDEPSTKLTLKYLRKLETEKDLQIIAHRGGGRITDFIPASENSVELIRLASRFGANGVEIDVQLTKDSIPVLYHDENINNRLTDKPGIHGTIDDYNYSELITKIKLKKGEKIPTLREALQTIIYQTPLQYVWLDVKNKDALEKTVALQKEFTQIALANGRKVEITLGIHDEEILEKFMQLPGHDKIPSICELSPEQTASINAIIWAALWTEGLQEEELGVMHKQGRRAFVWTVDKSEKMQEFMKAGYDGIVSNFPSLVAFYHYTNR